MKIGYPCINLSLDCKGDKTFRLKSYSKERLITTVDNNLSCLLKILKYNVKNQILFFRITSDLIPFASHPICTFDWQFYYQSTFENIGSYINNNKIRISMHPDQFIILNALDNEIINRSIDELSYHAEILDLMQLDNTAKIQIHIGGVYGDKKASIQRFISNYIQLPQKIKKRLVIENDHQRYHLKDCLLLSKSAHIPILFDYFHHKVYNTEDNISRILDDYISTWSEHDGIPMCDYSSQNPKKPPGAHADSIDLNDFHNFLELTKQYDIDVMLEIKDKERSAAKAISIAKKDKRFIKVN